MNEESITLPMGNLEIDCSEATLKKSLLAEAALESSTSDNHKQNPKPSVSSTQPSEYQEEEYEEDEYHDTFCACLKRLLTNCCLGVFIDSLKSGVLGTGTR